MQTRYLVSASLLVGAGLSLLSACSLFDSLSRTCTLKACGSTLTVELAAAPAGSLRVEATDVATNARRVFECSTSCGETVWFTDFTPAEVTVRVTTSAGSAERTFRPSYETVRPNGPGCEPVCRQARVTMPLPGT